MMGQARERVGEMASRMGLDHPMRRAEEIGEAAQHAGEYVAGHASRTIRSYPVTTVLAAAALGLFTGFLLTRRE